MTIASIITVLLTYGPPIIAGASVMSNGLNSAHPELAANPTFSMITKVINFLALNFVMKA